MYFPEGGLVSDIMPKPVLLGLVGLFLVLGAGLVWSGELAPGATMTDSNTGIEFAYIPAGSFDMGSLPDEAGRDGDENRHQVTLSQPFWMGTTEVTNDQYRRFVEATGHRQPEYWGESRFIEAKQPVVGVTWHDAVAFAAWAGMLLPTEAQWEYAARSGTTTRYWSGDSESDLARVGWYGGNSEQRLHAVGEKPANAWGLHDVHGNVWEWTADWHGVYPNSAQTNPTGPSSGTHRVRRGGSWPYGTNYARAADRHPLAPTERGNRLGFRLSKPIP